jgi:3-oxoacyl-[acyl-carrier-protein] synthase II
MITSRRRVVVTGMGTVSAAGLTADAVIDRVLSGSSAMGPITRFDAAQHEVRIAAEVPMSLDDGSDPFLEWGKRAAAEAMTAAGDASKDGERASVFVGTALASIAARERTGVLVHQDLASTLSATHGFRGPVLTLTSAFAASADAIGLAAGRIRSGEIDVALAGGAEAPVTPLVVAGFAAMGALSASNDCPEVAIRPFDRDRNGCGLGEGAAFLVLEERDRAIARGATILAELAGYGTSADALHITQLPEDGEGLVRAMTAALDDAGVRPEEVGYVNAHGTGTAMNDRVESWAIREVFGDHASQVGVSSTKPITGHLLGAAGAIEAVITIGALRRGLLPPTANWATRDPACDLDYIPDGSRESALSVAMSNSMGFGGHNAVLVFRKQL